MGESKSKILMVAYHGFERPGLRSWTEFLTEIQGHDVKHFCYGNKTISEINSGLKYNLALILNDLPPDCCELEVISVSKEKNPSTPTILFSTWSKEEEYLAYMARVKGGEIFRNYDLYVPVPLSLKSLGGIVKRMVKD